MKIAHNGTNTIAFHDGFDDISSLYPNLTILTVPDGTPIPMGDNGLGLIPTVDDTAAWSAIRSDRDVLLSKSDWTQVVDSPLDSAVISSWATYRQTLRDLPSTYTTPGEVVWPTEP